MTGADEPGDFALELLRDFAIVNEIAAQHFRHQ
jgi:hypothetical protein